MRLLCTAAVTVVVISLPRGANPAGYRGPMQPETLRGERVILRAVREQDAAALRAMRSTPEVVRWWREPGPGWPLATDAESVALTIEVAGAPAGFAQFCEEADPDYRHAAIDLFLAPAQIGRGLGADALRTLVGHLLADRGHHRVTIDPDVENERAIRCYERVGFRAVGVMRAYARDAAGGGWRDALLMDLLAGELRAPAEEAARG